MPNWLDTTLRLTLLAVVVLALIAAPFAVFWVFGVPWGLIICAVIAIGGWWLLFRGVSGIDGAWSALIAIGLYALGALAGLIAALFRLLP